MVADEVWMLTEEKMIVDLKITKKTKINGFFGRKHSTRTNFIINEARPPGFYKTNSTVEFEEGAEDRSDEYWAKIRHEPLSQQEENIDQMDVFCALTNDDEANILSSMLAKRLGAGKVMSLINRPAYVDLMESHGSIDVAISPQQITIGALLTHIRRGDVVAVHALRRGAAEAIEAVAHGDSKTSKVVGCRIDEIKLPEGASIGALVTIAPLVFSERLNGASDADIKLTCRAHLALTHPDESLMQVCDRYVQLLCGLMDGPDEASVKTLLLEASKGLTSTNLASLLKHDVPDSQVVGQIFSRACYISDSWPVVLYLACKYQNDPWQALQVNTNLGGDNVHRGIVLGTLLGLQSDTVATNWFEQLADHKLIAQEIETLISAASAPKL